MEPPQKQPSNLDRYKQLRSSTKNMSSKLHRAKDGNHFDMIKAAKKLTIPVDDRTLVFDGESDMCALEDFYFHDFWVGGRRYVDFCDPLQLGLDQNENELLIAMRGNRSSLFAPSAYDDGEKTVTLKDILQPDLPDVILTDISMTKSVAAMGEILLFFRVLKCGQLQMSSGCFFGFEAKHREMLLELYKRRMVSVLAKDRAERTFIFFYQQSKKIGMNMETASAN